MKILQSLFLLFCFLLPLVFNLQNVDSPFEFFKFLFSGVYICILGIVVAVVLLRNQYIQLKVSRSFIILLAIIAVNLLSYLFSVNPYLSLWGDNLLPSDSFASVLLFVLAAFIYEQLFEGAYKVRVAYALMAALALQVVYGSLQTVGMDFFTWNYAKPVFGTFGSTVSFSTFLGCLIPLAIVFYFSSSQWLIKALLLTLVAFSNFLVLETASRTPAAVSIIIQLITLFYFFKYREQNSATRPLALLAVTIFVIHGLFLFKPSEKETLKFKFGPEQLARGMEVRKILWWDGISAWKEKPILGYGPEAFSIAQRQFQGLEMNQTKHWHSSWVKAHNHLVQYLVSLGLVGLFAHLGLFAFVVRTIANLFSRGGDSSNPPIALAYGMGFIFLFLSNLTAFNFISTEFLYYLFPVFMISFVERKVVRLDLSKPVYKFLMISTLPLLLLFCLKFFNHYRADLAYQMSYASLNRGHNLQLASMLAEEAIKANDQDPAYHCHNSQIATTMLTEAVNINTEVKGYITASLDKEAELCKETAINRDHYFLQLANQYGQLFTSGIVANPEKSLEYFDRVKQLAPNVPIAYFRSGLIHLKAGNTQAFEAELENALELKNNYLPAYYELFQYYYKSQNIEKKYQLLERFSKLNQTPTELIDVILKLAELSEKNNDSGAKQVFLQKFSEFKGM